MWVGFGSEHSLEFEILEATCICSRASRHRWWHCLLVECLIVTVTGAAFWLSFCGLFIYLASRCYEDQTLYVAWPDARKHACLIETPVRFRTQPKIHSLRYLALLAIYNLTWSDRLRWTCLQKPIWSIFRFFNSKIFSYLWLVVGGKSFLLPVNRILHIWLFIF